MAVRVDNACTIPVPSRAGNRSGRKDCFHASPCPSPRGKENEKGIPLPSLRRRTLPTPTSALKDGQTTRGAETGRTVNGYRAPSPFNSP